jgi:hypothetical protein
VLRRGDHCMTGYFYRYRIYWKMCFIMRSMNIQLGQKADPQWLEVGQPWCRLLMPDFIDSSFGNEIWGRRQTTATYYAYSSAKNTWNTGKCLCLEQDSISRLFKTSHSLNGVSNGNSFVTKCKPVMILLAVCLFKRAINFETCNTARKYQLPERL